MLEGGIWPATEPTEQVWPFLGEHLKGSWQDPEYKAGNTPGGEGRELQKKAETLRSLRFRRSPAGRLHQP